MKMNKKGFTLIELMIVVAIIGILAAIAIPKFANLINKSKEGATKGALSTVRGAIQVYYGDNEGWFPTGDLALATLTSNGKYLNQLPTAKLPGTGKTDSSAVAYFKSITAGAFTEAYSGAADAGGWAYLADSTKPLYWGTFLVNSASMDINGQAHLVDATLPTGAFWTSF